MKIFASRLTVCVTRVWVGVDNAWEPKKLEARKMLKNAAESPASSALMKMAEHHFSQEKPGSHTASILASGKPAE
jgi:hypothetical protein